MQKKRGQGPIVSATSPAQPRSSKIHAVPPLPSFRNYEALVSSRAAAWRDDLQRSLTYLPAA